MCLLELHDCLRSLRLILVIGMRTSWHENDCDAFTGWLVLQHAAGFVECHVMATRPVRPLASRRRIHASYWSFIMTPMCMCCMGRAPKSRG